MGESYQISIGKTIRSSETRPIRPTSSFNRKIKKETWLLNRVPIKANTILLDTFCFLKELGAGPLRVSDPLDSPI